MKVTMKLTLKTADKKRLRAAAHHLKPIVMIGQNGYTEAIGLAIDEGLTAHELIKVRLRGIASEDRQTLSDEICEQYNAACVAIIGSIATFYRPNPES